MRDNDDFSAWSEDPLVRALRAPGTPTELAGETEFTAAYRSAFRRRSVRRTIGRLGMGGTAIVTTVALSSGVAAAYTNSLPDPIQRIAHSVLGPIGVPAAAPPQQPPSGRASASDSPTGGQSGRSVQLPLTTPSAGESGDPTQSASPTGSSASGPTSEPQPTQSTATSKPVTQPTTAPSPTSEPTHPVRRVPAALSASSSTSYAPVGTIALVTGLLTADDGQPLGDHRVRLRAHLVGQPGWIVMTRGVTAEDGSVVLETAALERNTVLRLSSGRRARSSTLRIVVQPTISAAATGGAITLSTAGGQPGDKVVVLRQTPTRLVRVATVVLDGSASASGRIPQRKRAQELTLRLKATRQHAMAVTTVSVESKSKQMQPPE